jgi:cyclopropane fatty-acyl-phospholipid synthase-like methyltransferase
MDDPDPTAQPDPPARPHPTVNRDPSDPDRTRYDRMRWNTPLSEDHAALLLERLSVGPADHVVDLGCGWGELLLRAVAASGATGTGVDVDADGLERGRRLAQTRGLDQRVELVEAEAAAWDGPADRLLCIGSSHVLGGTEQALARLAELTPPGGRLLYGDACWTDPPGPAAAQMFEEVLPLAELLEHVRASGWRVLHLSTADLREWDDFESTWRAARQEWLIRHGDDARAPGVRERLDAQLDAYVRTYRGVLQFCYLVLGH